MADKQDPTSPPPFDLVPVRARVDGWTPERQRAFIAALHARPCIDAAARAAGMSRESAYRLRRRPGAQSFAAAWDAALGMPVRRVTIDDLPFLACRGLIRPRFRGGKYVGSRQNPDNPALLRLLARLDRSAHGRHGEG